MQNTKNSQSKKITFFADVMLGRLVKWLRILGYDTAYNQSISSKDLVSRARKEKRVILSRDRRLIRTLSGSEYIFIENDKIADQLKQLVRMLGLDISENLFARCTVCNEPISLVNKEEIKNEVPEFVYKSYEEFSKCPKCGRVFWQGTHAGKIEEVIKSLYEQKN